MRAMPFGIVFTGPYRSIKILAMVLAEIFGTKDAAL
jgi:hypothetical protein